MRFNYRWLCEYLGFEPPLDELCRTLTMGGIEVEELLDLGAGHGRIVVGEALALEPHPQADRLRLVTVRHGEGAGDVIKLVCGAPNVEVGRKYPLALEGATLPDGLTIKKTKIRGVESCGMLCSARELGLSEDADGLMELPADSPLGRPFDAIIEVKVTPNRADALSLIGLARDVAALMGRRFSQPRPQVEQSLDATAAFTSVEVMAPDRCPRYMARIVRGVTVGPSPLWLRRRLEAAGLRSINNAVDITNHVLLEYGQPLHAFDLDNLDGRRVVVRLAAPGEKLRLLDETELQLTPDDLVIADAGRPQVLAGVMGGAVSGVTNATRNILLECAQFQPAGVRRAARRHGKSTDSSYRFERGIDRAAMPLALDRAADLLAELCGGTVARDPIDVATAPPAPRQLSLAPERVNRLLGTSLKYEQMAQALSALGFSLEKVGAGEITVTVPSFRQDVEQDVDLVEEIARSIGYDAIPYTMPAIQRIDAEEPAENRVAERLRQALASAGLNEAVTYSFTSPEVLAPFRAEASAPLIPVLNPLGPETSVMRDRLIPNLLRTAGINQRRQVRDLAVFEIGATFHPLPGYLAAIASGRGAAALVPSARNAAGVPQRPAVDATTFVAERQGVAVLLGGLRNTDWRTSGKGRAVDFYDVKGIAEAMLGALDIAGAELQAAADVPWLHPGRSAVFVRKGATLVTFGQVHPAVAEAFDLKDPQVFVLEADVATLAQAANAQGRKHRDLPAHPSMLRALAAVVADDVTAAQGERIIRREAGTLLESVRVFDVYRGTNLTPGTKSLAWEMVFRAPDRSLTDEETQAATDRIVAALESEVGASIRR